jgi:putative transposase
MPESEAKPQTKKRRSEADWRAIIARFDGSGTSMAEFCRRESIGLESFRRWRNHLDSSQQRASGFLELGTLPTPVEASRLELKLDLGCGIVLHLVRG